MHEFNNRVQIVDGQIKVEKTKCFNDFFPFFSKLLKVWNFQIQQFYHFILFYITVKIFIHSFGRFEKSLEMIHLCKLICLSIFGYKRENRWRWEQRALRSINRVSWIWELSWTLFFHFLTNKELGSSSKGNEIFIVRKMRQISK